MEYESSTAGYSFVEIDGSRSAHWKVEIGAIQGGLISPDLFKVGSLTQTMWNSYTDSAGFANDEIEVVAAENSEDCQRLAKRAAEDMSEWYDAVGLSLNKKKSGIISFGFDMEQFELGDKLLTPRSEIKFLGCVIQSNLRWDSHVEEITKKLHFSASRIRSEGRHFGQENKRILYEAWWGGVLNNNAAA